jgi:hypothetical protein
MIFHHGSNPVVLSSLIILPCACPTRAMNRPYETVCTIKPMRRILIPALAVFKSEDDARPPPPPYREKYISDRQSA